MGTFKDGIPYPKAFVDELPNDRLISAFLEMESFSTVPFGERAQTPTLDWIHRQVFDLTDGTDVSPLEIQKDVAMELARRYVRDLTAAVEDAG